MPEPPAEVTLTAAEVDALITDQHPSLRAPLRLVANGWDNEVFRLGEDLAVRLPRRQAAADLIVHEQRWLPELAGRLPVAIPAPIAAGAPGRGFPWAWSIVPWFPGSRASDLSPEERDAFAEPLATFLRALHRPAPADAPHNPVRAVPVRTRDEPVRARIGARTALREVWEAGCAAPDWSGAPVWVHGDLHPANLVTGGGGLVAVIDFGDLSAGDPATDLAAAWLAFTGAGRARFRAVLGDGYDDATWTRARAWAVAIATAAEADPSLHAVADHALRGVLEPPCPPSAAPHSG